MKRSAAILGPTPSFVRWAIRTDCPLRDLPEKNLPDNAFRELRGLRELSLGIRDNRVFEGVCIYPERNLERETVKGFLADEICEVFGGLNFVEDCCSQCPANACQSASQSTHHQPQGAIWAGCYGWFPSQHANINYVERFELAWNSLPDPPTIDGCIATNPRWYGLWQVRHWQTPKLKQLEKVITQTIEFESKETTPSIHLLELAAAIGQCIKHQLLLETELIPAGHSDGLQWRIAAHCPDCCKEMKAKQKDCPACGRHGHPYPETKKKVLGLRPYRLLVPMIGLEMTEKVMLNYQASSRP